MMTHLVISIFFNFLVFGICECYYIRAFSIPSQQNGRFSTVVDKYVEILTRQMEHPDKLNSWLKIRNELEKRIDKNSFETWFLPTVYIGEESGSLYVKVPNSYFKDWLSFHYSSQINSISQELYGKIYEIKFIFDDTAPTFIRRSPEERKSKGAFLLNPNLNPNYTFENFVVGSCNQFAHAAATAVVKNPAKSYPNKFNQHQKILLLLLIREKRLIQSRHLQVLCPWLRL